MRCGSESAESIVNRVTFDRDESSSESRKGRMADALALEGDEGRDKLR